MCVVKEELLSLCNIDAAFAPSPAGIATRSPSLALSRVSARKAPAVTMAMAEEPGTDMKKIVSTLALSALLLLPSGAIAGEQLGGNFKVLQGAASTQDSGSRRTITRGAVLDRSDFSNRNLAGISFQQSLCRECNFEASNLKGASFFDGDLTQVCPLTKATCALTRAAIRAGPLAESY